MTEQLVPSGRFPSLLTHPSVEVPDDARIGPYVTIHSGVRLGAGVTIEQGAIVGRPQQIDARSRSTRVPDSHRTTIGDGCLLGAYSIIGDGVVIGPGSYVGDGASLRETAVVGDEAVIGRGCSLSQNTAVGDRTRLQNLVILGPWTVIEEDVLVSPRVTFVGDPTMGRRPYGEPSPGIVVRRAARFGTAAIISQGIEIGEEAVVGAGALVRSDVPRRTVVVGSPARELRQVADHELLEAWRVLPGERESDHHEPGAGLPGV